MPAESDVRAEGRRNMLREGALWAVMQGGGESYLSAFALLLHASPFQIGLLTAIPHVIGTWSQLLSVKVLARLRDRKRVAVAGAAGQALAWLPLFLLPLLVPSYAPWLLIAGTVLYFATGHFMVPAWNSLITELIDNDSRGAYFAQRARIVAVMSFATLSIAGLVLQYTEASQTPWLGFGLIFLVAASARLASARVLAQVHDPSGTAETPPPAGVRVFFRHRSSAHFRRFLLYSGGLHLTASIAGPFYVVYLLNDLHFSYTQYGIWMGAPIVAQLMTLKEWGRIGDKFGNKKVLVVTGLVVPFLPMLYLCSTDWLVLSCVNFLAGATWSGLGLSLMNYVFDAVAPVDRPKGVAIYNTVNAITLGAGALLGSWLIAVAPDSLTLLGMTLSFASNLPIVFCASGLLRLLIATTLLGTFAETRAVTPISHRQLLHELPLIKPVAGRLGVRGQR